MRNGSAVVIVGVLGFCDVLLEDDGTLDTVLSVDSKYGSTKHRFGSEYVSRDGDGELIESVFVDLACEAADDHIQQLTG